MAGEGGRMSLASAMPGRAHLAPKPVRPATAECRVGVAKQDITPPVGVYNRLCGTVGGQFYGECVLVIFA